MSKTILMIGSFDTKGEEYCFLREQILALGCHVLTVNTGVLGSTNLFLVDYEAEDVVCHAGRNLSDLRLQQDRGEAMKTMAQGAHSLVQQIYSEGGFDGVIGMGGSGGTSVVTAAMRALPIGVPKVCISTVAGGDTAPYVGLKDVTMIPSITDVSGSNHILQMILSRAAGAVCGMVSISPMLAQTKKPTVAASMFGNTTQCVTECQKTLEQAGFEVLVFHATGVGGRMMESLIDQGLIDACLDITTTEWADRICGGVFDAGEDRLSAPGRKGIPHLIVPGCVDMVNFGPPETVPRMYREASRLFYEWNPSVTLMRTNVEENQRIGRDLAAKANLSTGPVAFLLPLRGVSQLDGDGQLFCDRKADQALFDSIKNHVQARIPVEEVDTNINDLLFSQKASSMLLELIHAQALLETF